MQSSDQPIDWQPSHAFLRFVIMFILAVSAVFFVGVWIYLPEQHWRLANPLLTTLVALTAWILLERGQRRAAVHVLAFGTWLVLTGAAFVTGGVAAPLIVVYPMTVLVTGWLLGTRVAAVITVMTVLATLVFVQADAAGWLPAIPASPPLMRWGVVAFVAVITLLLIEFFVRSYRERLRDVRQLGRQLAQRTAEVEAREAELNRAQSVAHIGSWVYRFARDEIRMSKETSVIYGLPEGAIGSYSTFLARVHEEDRAALDHAWRAATEGGIGFDFEHRILVGDMFRWVRQRAEVEYGADGSPVRAVGTTQDITAQRTAGEALRASEQRFRDLLQHVPSVAVQGYGADRRVFYWNHATEHLYGYSAAEAVGRDLLDLIIPEETRGTVAAAIARMAETGKPEASGELSLMRKDGSRVSVYSSHAVVDIPGRGRELFCIDVDLTERKQAEALREELEAQLREAHRMEALGTLAGGIAHDFNNILAAILGNLALARQDVGAGHAALGSLEEIGKAGQRGKALVQQILAYCRRQVLERKAVSLAPVVQESARLLRITLPAEVALNVDCSPDAPLVLADATQVEQVLLNLCNNAAQAMRGQDRPAVIDVQLSGHLVEVKDRDGPVRRGRGGHVTLRPGRYACLTVRDNGPGMDDTTRSRMFEPFFTTKPVGDGTGLGLSVVQGIVQAHEAHMLVQSEPGQGTQFKIYFPALDAPQEAEMRNPTVAPTDDGTSDVRGSRVPAPDPSGRHILYLDDDESMAYLVKRQLERRGFRVSAYTDPHRAITAMRADPARFDLVVSDYNMPGVSGLEVARLIRDIRADLPVAITSGYVTEELQALAPAAGVRELISKPDSVEELCAALSRLVEH